MKFSVNNLLKLNTRLSGRFAPILYLTFNCCSIFQHFLYDNVTIFFLDLQNFTKITTFLYFWASKPHKTWARTGLPFWRLLDTNKQTDKKTIYIDFKNIICFSSSFIIYKEFDENLYYQIFFPLKDLSYFVIFILLIIITSLWYKYWIYDLINE